MQYLENTTEAQTFTVPATGLLDGTSALLKIRSTVAKSDVLSAPVTFSGNSHLYYKTSVTLPSGLKDGEYEYTLTQNGQRIGGGMVVIGLITRAGNPGTATITFKQL